MIPRSGAFECVVNLSEGRDSLWLESVVNELSGAVDLHLDSDHHRSVVTLLGAPEQLLDQVLKLARRAVAHLDLRLHEGVHPRLGVIDVVPFVPLGSATLFEAAALRDETARRFAEDLALPCFLYGPLTDGSERTLPDVRRSAFETLGPDYGPAVAHPSAGAVALGARPPLLAWNLWLTHTSLERARELATALRGPQVRALGFAVEGAVQVSCNLLAPSLITPAEVADQLAGLLEGAEQIQRAELVGLVPGSVLDAVPRSRWGELDLSPERSIEAACSAAGISVS